MLRNQKRGKEFRSEVSQQGPLDIEDLVQIGNDLKICPYYGSRSMVHTADLVVLPYQSLLSKSSRESLGLSLKDSVVVIDEAHNLADSLVSMYNAKITLSQVKKIFQSLPSATHNHPIWHYPTLKYSFLCVLLPSIHIEETSN